MLRTRPEIINWHHVHMSDELTVTYESCHLTCNISINTHSMHTISNHYHTSQHFQTPTDTPQNISTHFNTTLNTSSDGQREIQFSGRDPGSQNFPFQSEGTYGPGVRTQIADGEQRRGAQEVHVRAFLCVRACVSLFCVHSYPCVCMRMLLFKFIAVPICTVI